MTEPATALGPPAAGGPETVRERLAYGAYRVAERAAVSLPEPWGRRLFGLGGAAAFHLAPGARSVVQGNLGRVLGPTAGPDVLRAATREAFLSYARYWYEAFRIRVMPDEEFMSRWQAEGAENLEAAVKAGRGAIVALPHIGNWDAAGRWVHLRGWRITAVAELLRPERLFRMFLDNRRALGMSIVPLYDDRTVGRDLIRRLSENEVIALVADRDLKGRGVPVEMFGETRLVPPGPALLSLVAGSPLLPCATYDTEDGWVVHIDAPLEIERTDVLRDDVTTLTRALAGRFERAIAAAPTQWHMFQPAWPDGDEAAPEGGPADVLGSGL
jgi:phosphatidylinositol dimannoside acyltransferase